MTNNEEMSNILNEYFGSVFTDEKLLDELPEVKNLFTGDYIITC